MEIRWNGHACFTVSHDGWRIVLDPYAPGTVEGCPPLALEAEQILCSHGHSDHNYAEAVTLVPSDKENPFRITELASYHDDQRGALRGENTIRILEADGLRVAHMGDLGCELTPEQTEALRGVDALLVPVGGFFTIDARAARDLVELLQPRVIIPMHYSAPGYGLKPIAPLTDFTELMDPALLKRRDGPAMTLDHDTPRQVAILRRPDEL